MALAAELGFDLFDRRSGRRIQTVEADRSAFLTKHFHADFADPTNFDLVVNTAALGAAGACSTVRAALDKLSAPASRWPVRPLTRR